MRCRPAAAVVCAAAIAAFALSATSAAADIVVTNQLTLAQGKTAQTVLFASADRVRMEAPGNVTLFRADQNVAYIVTPAQKKFLRLTPQGMRAAAAQMDMARVQLAAQLKSLPAEQRARLEKMMGKAMPGPGQAPHLEFRKTGASATYGKWNCEGVEQLSDGKPQAKLCVARLADLGLDESDLGALQRLAAFMQQAMPQSASAAATVDPKALEKTVGYPAFVIHSEAGSVTTTLQSVEKKPLAADLFEVPAGYTEEKSPLAPH